MSARDLVLHVVLLIALLLVAPRSSAVIIASGDGTGNTAAPEDDFGFANVGDAGQSAVYLGDGWVISANHVSLGRVVLAGQPYEPVPDSKVRIPNPGGVPLSDLALFRLQEPWPELPALRLRVTSPSIGDEVVLAGNGHDRGEPVVIDGNDGWRWAASTSLRWGTNRVSGLHPSIRVTVHDTTSAFSTEFDPQGATEHEAQVAVGDSGGGVFIKRDGTWELAGVLFAAGGYDAQPPATVLFGNVSLAVDLSTYRDEILAIIRRPDQGPPSADCTGICGDGFALSLLLPGALLARRRPGSRSQA